MELILQDSQSTLTVSEAIFGRSFNKTLVHQVVTAYAASARQGTKAQKSRAEVTGSSRKPWRQKGTGRARSGSIKSPIWRSGGVTFAASPKNYNQKINRKMYRSAMKSILSELVRQERLIVVKDFSIEVPKTKLLVKKLKDMSLKDMLIITHKLDKKLSLSARNLHKIGITHVKNINPINLITFDTIMMTVDAIKQVEEILI